jgi:Bacterial Ig-like domain (group 2).
MFILFSFSVLFSVTSIADDSGLAAHWTFDGNLKDSSGNSNDGTAIGKITYVNSVFGQGAKFENKAYIEVADSSSLDLSTAFTFSLWVYKEPTNPQAGGVPYIAKIGTDAQSDYWPYGLTEWSWQRPMVSYGWQDDGNTSGDDVDTDKQVDIQKWTLLTATFDGRTIRIYENNELLKSEDITQVELYNSSGKLYIGYSNFMTKEQHFTGVMDDLRIYNKALSPDEVEGLYNAGSEGPGKDLISKPKKLVAFYKFEGNGKDQTTFANNGTAINSKGGITYTTGMNGKAAKFNRASYFEVKDSDSLDLDNAFTIGMWISGDVESDKQTYLVKYGSSMDHDGNNEVYSVYAYGQGGPQVYLEDLIAEGNDSYATQTDTTKGAWHYFTATFDGKEVKTYINGKLVQTYPFENIIPHSAKSLRIGASSSDFFKGCMDELKIYNYALNAEEVKAQYNLKDSIKIVPVTGSSTPSVLKTKKVFAFKVNLKSADTGKTTDITKTATYKSSNPKVIKVENGKITAIGKGKATVTATYGPHTSSVTITVN